MDLINPAGAYLRGAEPPRHGRVGVPHHAQVYLQDVRQGDAPDPATAKTYPFIFLLIFCFCERSEAQRSSFYMHI